MQNKWLWGCGIGCGAVIVLVGLAGVGIAQLGLGDKAKSAVTDELRKYYDELHKQGKIKPELQEPISELITLLQRPETPFFAGMTTAGIATEFMTSESVSTDKALAVIADFRDLLKQKPEPSLDDIDALCTKHAAIMRQLKEETARRIEEKRSESHDPSTGD